MSIKNTKVMRFQIIKPLDCEWKLFGHILNELRSKTRYILNKGIQGQWEWDGFSSEYKKLHDNYPNTKEILGYSGSQAVRNYVKLQIKDEIAMFNSSNVDSILNETYSKWNTHKKDIFAGKVSIPSYRRDDVPIFLRDTSLQIHKDEDCYMANLSLISNSYRKELDRKNGQFLVLLKAGDGTQKAILDRVINGEYKRCASQIIQHKNKWFLNLTYQFISEEKKLNKYKVMGVDLGITNVATMQIFNTSTNKYDYLKYNQCVIDGKELIHFRQKTEARKRDLQKQSKVAGGGRVGHGYNARMKPVLRVGDKVARFRDTYNHKVSKYIVEFALRNECGIIQMEDLSGFTEKAKESFLKNWSYYDLQTKIEYKAKEHGIEVIKVDPRYTSKRCNKCGTIHSENRDCKTNQSKFKCVECGHEDNADINAAKNLAIPYIDTIIKESLKNIA